MKRKVKIKSMDEIYKGKSKYARKVRDRRRRALALGLTDTPLPILEQIEKEQKEA